MKRQPKPFAVEIKRSRRSPLPPLSSKSGFLESARSDPDEGALLEKGARSSSAELAIPAFLQSDKASRRPVSKTNPREDFTSKDQVFASAPSPRRDDSQPSDDRARPRILPSLIPNVPAAEPERQTKRARKAAAAKNPTRGRKEKTQAAPQLAPETEAPSRENAAAPKPRSPVRSNPIRKRSRAASKDLANGQANKPAAATLVAPTFTANPSRDDLAPTSAMRRSARRGRHDAADLPLGQRWKRRLHPCAW